MGNNLNKYFADELTTEERNEFLSEVNSSEELREEFIEYQNLLGFIDWTFSKNDEELAQRKLSEFMHKIEEHEI